MVKPMNKYIPSKKIVKMEENLAYHIDEYFPMEMKENGRSKALILISMAKDLGVQGHADYAKQKKNDVSKQEGVTDGN